MNFAGIPSGARVFLDANILVYHFTADPKVGAVCTQLIKRVELRDLEGSISTHVLADVAHRLMTLEAMQLFSWPATAIAARLRKNHAEIPKLQASRLAVASIQHLGIQVLAVTQPSVELASLVSAQFELLTGDALIVAIMQQHGLSLLASNDADFDRVPSITRCTPI